MNRLKITLGVLFAMGWVGLARAQTAGSAPPPPPPGRVESPALEGPATDLKPITDDRTELDLGKATDADTPAAGHDALLTNETQTPRPGDRARAPKQPPELIAERPSGSRPQPRAVWVPGYWDWEPARAEFVWMGGIWQVPPTGTIWVASRWMRDGDGWYRRPGFWSRRRDAVVATSATGANDRLPAWRTIGPPAEHPPDMVADAPGPDYFLIPGHFAPDGDQLRWQPSFWTRVQAGWDWIPARWVRRPAGWEFRSGHWAREPDGIDLRVTVNGRPRARATAPGAADPDGAIEVPPPPPGTENERDPIAEAEAAGRVRVVVPGTGMPYYVIRPPGSYPYGPGGVIVPGAVPPFVRRILDQVLP
jgi:hypothetical protein